MLTQITSFTCGPASTNCYLIIASDTHVATAVLIDAPHGCAPLVLETLAEHNATLLEIYLTHSHWDHTAEVAPLVAATRANVHVHELDAYRLENPMEHSIWELPFTIEPVLNWRPLVHNQVLESANICLRVLFTPGHTEGSVCFYDAERGLVYAGDTLFEGSIGRTDLPGGDTNTLYKSIQTQLYKLPGEVVVLPGHGEKTSVNFERNNNPFVQDIQS